jgi:hypothetical protein
MYRACWKFEVYTNFWEKREAETVMSYGYKCEDGTSFNDR